MHDIRLEEGPQRAIEQCPEAVILAPSLLYLIVAVAVILLYTLANEVLCQVNEAHLRPLSHYFLDPTVHFWRTVNDGWPHRSFPLEEAKDIVAQPTACQYIHYTVAPWDVEAVGAVGRGHPLVEILTQLRRYKLVGVDHEHPLRRCSLYGKLACRLHTTVVGLWESHNLAAMPARYVDRMVGALHIANHYRSEE